MQTFNLTRLNFHSPYKVWIEDNEYKFITDYDEIVAGMGQGMSSNNAKFCQDFECIVDEIMKR